MRQLLEKYFGNSYFNFEESYTECSWKYYSQIIVLGQCHTVQEDWALLGSVGSPLDAAWSIAGKLAWRNIQFFCLLIILGVSFSLSVLPYVQKTLQYESAWQGDCEDQLLFVQHFIQAEIYSNGEGLMSVGINGKSV